MIRKVLFIDINVLKQIQQKNKQIINKIDKYNTLVSIWLPLYETIIFHKDINKVKESLLKNSKILNNTLKKSKHDANFFLEYEELLKDVFENILYNDTLQNYMYFLKKVLPMVALQKKIFEIPNAIDKMINIASEYNIQLTHPVFIIPLSILLGNNSYRKLLKPSQSIDNEKISNIINDILTLSRLELFKNIVRNHPTHLTKPIIKFITLDKHLETFLKEYHVNYSSLIESVTLININISLDLFPILNDKKLTINKKLKNTIEKKLQKIFISQTPP